MEQLQFFIFEIIQKISWDNFFTALCGAGFGAFAAYCLNRHLEKIKLLDNQKLRFLHILHFAYYLNDYLLAFKIKTLPPFIASLNNKSNQNDDSPYIQTSFSFDIDINDYLFLFKNNSHLYYLLRKIETHINILNSDIQFLNNLASIGFSLHKPLIEKTIEDNDNLINLTDILFNALLKIPYKDFSKMINLKEFISYQEEKRKEALDSAKHNPNLLKGWEGAITTWKK